MAEILDDLIEEVEVLNTEIAKINFDIDGFKEESDRLIEKQPFMVRHIQQNEKKMFKLLKHLDKRMSYKYELDSKLKVMQMEHKAKAVDKTPKTIKKTKPKQ